MKVFHFFRIFCIALAITMISVPDVYGQVDCWLDAIHEYWWEPTLNGVWDWHQPGDHIISGDVSTNYGRIGGIYIYPGARIHFADGATWTLNAAFMFYAIGTPEAPIEFHFWPDESGSCGGLVFNWNRALQQEGITRPDSCLVGWPSTFSYCKFISHSEGANNDEVLVNINCPLKIKFDHCTFENTGTALLIGNLNVTGTVPCVVDYYSLSCAVTNCTFTNVHTGIRGDRWWDRQEPNSSQLTWLSLGVWITNNRFRLREWGYGIYLSSVHADRYLREGFAIPTSEFAIEGNIFESYDNTYIGAGIKLTYFSGPTVESTVPEANREVSNNYIRDASIGIDMRFSRFAESPGAGSLSITGNIIELPEDASSYAIYSLTGDGVDAPIITGNVLRTFEGQLADIGPDYWPNPVNYSFAIPEDYENRDYHFNLDDTDFLFTGPHTDVYGNAGDIGIYGGSRAEYEDVYHVVSDNHTFNNTTLPTYGYFFEGRANVNGDVQVGDESWLAFEENGGITIGTGSSIIGENLIFTSSRQIDALLADRSEQGGGFAICEVNTDPDYTNRGWEGLLFNSSETESNLSGSIFADADIAVHVKTEGRVNLGECEVRDSRIAIVGETNARITCSDVTLKNNGRALAGYGLIFDGDDMVIENNLGGILVTSGHLDLDNSTLQWNGTTDWTHFDLAAILNYGGNIRLRCCTIERNMGPGLYLGSDAFFDLGINELDLRRHNSISNNGYSSQIVASGDLQNLILQCGDNQINGYSGLAVQLIDPPANGSALDWEWNYWGVSDCGEISERLSIAPFTADVDPCLTSWSSECPTTPDPCNPTSECLDSYVEAMADEEAELYTQAKSKYQDIVESYPQCEFAPAAAAKLPVMDAWGAAGDNSRDYLRTVATTTPATDLETKAYTEAAWIALNENKLDSAAMEFDSLLIWAADWQDSIPALAGKLMVDYHFALEDTSETRSAAELFFVAQDSLSNMISAVASGFNLAPFILHTPESYYIAADDTASITCIAYEEAEAVTGYDDTVSVVIVNHRLLPNETWTTDTLDGDGLDSTYTFDIPLNSLGGLLEYQLFVKDSRNRIASSPVGGYYISAPDSNPSHFVSIEPSFTGELGDTAYVYAPGRITRDIEIGHDGVLFVLPALNDEQHIVIIDSGVVLWAKNSESHILIEGNEDSPLILTAQDSTKYWYGIKCNSGLVSAQHATISHSQYPLTASLTVSGVRPMVRLVDVTIRNGATPISLNDTRDSGSDSSIFDHVTIEDMDSVGMFIADGTLLVDELTIQNCDNEGLKTRDTDGLLITNSIFTQNGGSGVSMSEISTNIEYEVRFENCKFCYNAEDDPEVYVCEYGYLDIAGGANNVFQDTCGSLLYVQDNSVELCDLENGNNLFIGVDSGAVSYIDYANPSASVVYITGNYFSPVNTTDSASFLQRVSPDDPDFWIYCYLRCENQVDTIISDPGDSLDFSVRAYLENYLGVADTITEIGFKYKVLPNDTAWTTERTGIEANDSLYSWWINVGDNGGLVNYIFWSKDTHGRFITSPLNADTTYPDSGRSHFTTFEMVDTVITYDTVTIWAPTTINHSINVYNGGHLEIKPWPGASDHTVIMGENVSISVGETPAQRSELIISGTESMPITLASASDTTGWGYVLVYTGAIRAEYATFSSSVFGLQTSGAGNPVVQFDHCAFDGVHYYHCFDGLDKDSSYFRNCNFVNAENGDAWGMGTVFMCSGDVELTDCAFYNNTGYGLYLYDAYETEINGCSFIGNDYSGLCTDGYTSSVEISCSEFSYNGADSIAEVLVHAGSFDFSDGANCIFADASGPLLEGTSMANFELVGGENGFFLFDSTGTYLLTDDQADTMDITYNYWYPYSADTSIFWDFFGPDSSRYWINDSVALAVGACGEGGSYSVPGTPELVRLQMPAAPSACSIPSTLAGKRASSDSRLTAKRRVNEETASLFADAVQLQKAREYARAVEKYETYIAACDPQDYRIASALSRHFVSARKAGKLESLSRYYSTQERAARNAYTKKVAHGLYLESLVFEGKVAEALAGYEEMIRKPTSQLDSVQAVIGAMQIHYRYGRTTKLPTAFPENRVYDFPELARRMVELSKIVKRTGNVPLASETHSAIPTEYRLYQNYPNPFNPITDIRFDLPEAVRVELSVFNILGQEVAKLVDEVRPAGVHQIQWDSKSNAGIQVASGVYVYQLKAGNFLDAKKMILLR